MHPVHNGGSTEDLRMRQDPSPSRCIRVKVQLTHPLAVIHPICINISIFFLLFFYFISASILHLLMLFVGQAMAVMENCGLLCGCRRSKWILRAVLTSMV